MIKLRNVNFKYDKVILDNINLDINKNKITFIIGMNGSGKTTLANIISGLLFVQSGEVYLDNLKLDKKVNSREIRKKIGIVFQNPSNQIIFPKVYDDIKFTLENMKVDKDLIPKIINDSLKKVGMIDYIDSNPYNLSGGEKQRIAVASQLSLKLDYLIFDEATSMLDINGKKDIYKLLGNLKKNMGIIFITNNMNELIYADDIVIIDNHNLYKYTLLDIIKDNDILTKHKLDVPFIFKIINALNIKDINEINEKSILERISKK